MLIRSHVLKVAAAAPAAAGVPTMSSLLGQNQAPARPAPLKPLESSPGGTWDQLSGRIDQPRYNESPMHFLSPQQQPDLPTRIFQGMGRPEGTQHQQYGVDGASRLEVPMAVPGASPAWSVKAVPPGVAQPAPLPPSRAPAAPAGRGLSPAALQSPAVLAHETGLSQEMERQGQPLVGTQDPLLASRGITTPGFGDQSQANPGLRTPVGKDPTLMDKALGLGSDAWNHTKGFVRDNIPGGWGGVAAGAGAVGLLAYLLSRRSKKHDEE